MKFLVVPLLLMMPLTVQAEEPICESLAELAYAAMIGHQYGVPLSQMLGVVNNVAADNPQEREAATAIILKAYKQRRYHTDEHKMRAVQDFQTEIHLICLDAANQ